MSTVPTNKSTGDKFFSNDYNNFLPVLSDAMLKSLVTTTESVGNNFGTANNYLQAILEFITCGQLLEDYSTTDAEPVKLRRFATFGASLDYQFLQYLPGMQIRFINKILRTGPFSVNLSNISDVPDKDHRGNDLPIGLVIPLDSEIVLRYYNGINAHFRLLSIDNITDYDLTGLIVTSFENNRVGFIEANGAEITKTQYQQLYNYAIANNRVLSNSNYNSRKSSSGGPIGFYGESTNSNNFLLPDLRDVFLSIKSDSRESGSFESDTIGPHGHYFQGTISGISGGTHGFFATNKAPTNIENVADHNRTRDDGINIGSRTKPRDIALYALIKY